MPARDFAVLVVTNQDGPNGPGEKGCIEARQLLIERLLKSP
jgi:hypothetical protein